MKPLVSQLAGALALTLFSAVAGTLHAAELKGVVLDPSRQPVPGAQVAAFNDVGVIVQQTTDDRGRFDFVVSPLYENVQLRVTAAGFQTITAGETAAIIQLALAPQSDSVHVTGSAIDAPGSQQGSGVSVISSAEIRERNEAQAVDLLRELPGLVLAQNGPRGSVTDLFVRGGDPKYNLVEINGIPVNSFYYGGLFDFAHIASDFISEIDVARGPQSATTGSYAIGGVVNFVTRSPENGPALDLVAEGGTHEERHFAVSGSAMVHGWGAAGSVSTFDGNGAVRNADYRNDNGFLSLEHRWYSQSLFAFGDYDSNDAGEPGPFGSNPRGYYSGIDLVSRSRNNTSTYGLHYQNDLSSSVKLEGFAGFFLNNSLYISPYGTSFNKDLRAYGEARGTWAVNRFWTLAGGFAFDREEMKNTYVTDTSSRRFPLRRDNEGVYLENRLGFRNRLFVNAGLREEIFETPFVPGNLKAYTPRPDFPSVTESKLNPKVSGVYMLDSLRRLHASFGTGIRPPGGSDLAFTNNPALKPEHTTSYDIGVEQRLLGDRLSLDATWFYNRYRDQIVSLGGSLSKLSSFQTDNLSNSKGEGVEITARYRPSASIFVTGNYMWLETEVLSLNGGSGLVQQYYTLGQPLLRRPKQTGSLLATFHRGRLDANVAGTVRGRSLDVEPSYGASGGLYWNPGFTSANLNVNYRVRANLTAYVNLRNALDRSYEEIYGYPAPLLNVVAGLKWSLARAR